MTDFDAMDWLNRGLGEIDAAETLEEARDEARGLTIYAAVRMWEFLEIHVLHNWRLFPAGHPIPESMRAFKTAHNKLHDVYADMRQRDALAEEGAA